MTLQIGVLASGRGSNFQALINSLDTGEIDAEIAVLVVNRRDARAVERAERHGIPWVYVDHRNRAREDFEKEVMDVLDSKNVELVVLAGFMRILTPFFVKHYEGRLINVHPALLPSFPGTQAQRDALEYGVRITGCTVHFVTTDVDNGPIIIQRCVPVHGDDTESSLSMKILREEHKALPEAVHLYAQGLLEIHGKRVNILDPEEGTW